MHRHTTPTIEIQMLLNYLLPLPVAPAAVATTPHPNRPARLDLRRCLLQWLLTSRRRSITLTIT